MNHLRIALVLAAFATALPAASADKIYQWKDANGVTHYSDAPPPAGDYSDREIVRSEAAPAPVPAPADAATAPPVQDARCAQARLNLQRLQGGGVVGLDADRDGKPDAPLDEADRAAQVEIARAAIQARCPPAAP